MVLHRRAICSPGWASDRPVRRALSGAVVTVPLASARNCPTATRRPVQPGEATAAAKLTRRRYSARAAGAEAELG